MTPNVFSTVFTTASKTESAGPPSASTRVQAIKGMAMRTMRLSRIHASEAFPSQQILSSSNGLEMLRIYAEAITAEVVEIQSVRNRSTHHRPHVAMRPPLSLADDQLPVASGKDVALPYPARRGEIDGEIRMRQGAGRDHLLALILPPPLSAEAVRSSEPQVL